MALWLSTNYWLVLNLIGISITINGLAFLRLSSLRVALVLLLGYLCLDVFFVFLSGYFFSESVM